MATAGLLTGTSAAGAEFPVPFPAEPPGDAEVGQCFQRVRLDAQYNTLRETVVVSEGYQAYEVFVNGRRIDGVRYGGGRMYEPVLQTGTRQYLAREAGMRYRVTEPVYETRRERVLVRPAYTQYVVIPAQRENVTERVMVREARMVWRRGYVEGARAVRHDPESGDVWCLIEEPAEYRSITRTVVVQPERVEERHVEALYDTISREVLVQQARIEEIPIPEQYASYQYQSVVHPAEVRARYVEEETDILERYELIAPERHEWRLISCDQMHDIGRQPPTPGTSPWVETPASSPLAQRSSGTGFSSHSSYDHRRSSYVQTPEVRSQEPDLHGARDERFRPEQVCRTEAVTVSRSCASDRHSVGRSRHSDSLPLRSYP